MLEASKAFLKEWGIRDSQADHLLSCMRAVHSLFSSIFSSGHIFLYAMRGGVLNSKPRTLAVNVRRMHKHTKARCAMRLRHVSARELQHR